MPNHLVRSARSESGENASESVGDPADCVGLVDREHTAENVAPLTKRHVVALSTGRLPEPCEAVGQDATLCDDVAIDDDSVRTEELWAIASSTGGLAVLGDKSQPAFALEIGPSSGSFSRYLTRNAKLATAVVVDDAKRLAIAEKALARVAGADTVHAVATPADKILVGDARIIVLSVDMLSVLDGRISLAVVPSGFSGFGGQEISGILRHLHDAACPTIVSFVGCGKTVQGWSGRALTDLQAGYRFFDNAIALHADPGFADNRRAHLAAVAQGKVSANLAPRYRTVLAPLRAAYTVGYRHLLP